MGTELQETGGPVELEPRSITDVARERFGDNFVGESASERQETAEYRQRMRGYMKIAQEKGRLPTSKEATPDSVTEPQWSNQDLAVVEQLGQRKQQIQQAVNQQLACEAAFKEQYGNIDLNALRESDPARWAQINTDARTLQESANHILTAINQYQQQEQQVRQAADYRDKVKVYKSEYQKMVKAEPALERPEVRAEVSEHLVGQGFTREQVEGCLDHRLIVQAFRSMRSEQPERRKVPVLRRKPKKPAGKIKRARNKLKESGDIYDALDLLTARRQANQQR